MSVRHCRAAAFLSTLVAVTCTGCASTAAGIGGTGGGPPAVGADGPAGTGDCFERLTADPGGALSGITIEGHRVVASISVWCTGSVAPAAYKVTLIVVKDGVHGAGNNSTAIPTAVPMTVKASTACAPGVYSAWYTVAGSWPGGLPIKAASGIPITRTVKSSDC